MAELPPFANEPVLELRRAPVRGQLAGALAALDAQLPLRVPVRIGGDARHGDQLASTDPGAPGRLVATAAEATADEVAAAIATAQSAGREWATRTPLERSAILLEAAQWLRERRLEAAALVLREAAKPWPEADADVCEAIDFLEYYARGALELARGAPLLQLPGERNQLRWVARGVAGVISPWNFPLAIPCGMTAAALVTGNAVLLKPAEQAPACADLLWRALTEAGVPSSALALLPGGGEVGAQLVRDPRLHVIAFTGSLEVGREIWRTAGEVAPGQRHFKRVVAELGGKNCVIVDADADLDEVVPALLSSAFGYAGQKCSAAARVLCHEAIHDRLLERLAGALTGLRVGPADELATDVPPLIEEAAQRRVNAYREQAAQQGRLVAADGVPAGGWYTAPAVAAELPEDSSVLHEEIFGPLLALERVRDVEEACERVEASPFGLTGGLFARNPDTVARVVARSPVGNLYVNREITGAMVGRQPFGGNRLSGTGAKAGGPTYLLEFVEARTVSESTLRHGLVIE
jgi:RHH-type proline utilization regulon transcriptional repressor/proline dehydrogenase/delta 1-pyrroline-5-carboxylate dehydrogenase